MEHCRAVCHCRQWRHLWIFHHFTKENRNIMTDTCCHEVSFSFVKCIDHFPIWPVWIYNTLDLFIILLSTCRLWKNIKAEKVAIGLNSKRIKVFSGLGTSIILCTCCLLSFILAVIYAMCYDVLLLYLLSNIYIYACCKL